MQKKAAYGLLFCCLQFPQPQGRGGVFLESMSCDGRGKTIHGQFSFVAIDDDKRPVPVLPGFAV
jgi:hypothetical protein